MTEKKKLVREPGTARPRAGRLERAERARSDEEEDDDTRGRSYRRGRPALTSEVADINRGVLYVGVESAAIALDVVSRVLRGAVDRAFDEDYDSPGDIVRGIAGETDLAVYDLVAELRNVPRRLSHRFDDAVRSPRAERGERARRADGPSSDRQPAKLSAPLFRVTSRRPSKRRAQPDRRGRSARVLLLFTRFMLAFLFEEALRHIPLLPSLLGREATFKNPERLRKLLEDLGGAFIKFGQLFSMRSDILPPEYCTALGSLFDDVPPFASSEARAIIEKELGRRIDDMFSSFVDQPIGAASFGQVHLATLKGGEDEGRKAAIKVIRPGSEETIETDARLLILLGFIVDTLSILGRIKLVPVFRDFVRWTRREVNYLQEAKNADHLHELTHWNPRQRIPYIYWDKSTKRVLTMEYLEGLTVNEIIRRFEAGDTTLDEQLAEMSCDRATIARNIWQTYMLQCFVGHVFHGDPHPGNLIVLPENVVGFIDFGLIGRLNEEARREQGLMLDAVAKENIERLFVATLDVLDAPRGLLVTDTYEDFAEAADGWLDACDNPGAGLAEKTINRLVSSSMHIARQVGLVLSPHTMLYYKGVITVDSVVLRVNPEFDYKKETSRALRLIRMRELDRLYAPGNVIDSALVSQLLLAYAPDFLAGRLQDFEQGQRLIYRKLNMVPIVLGTLSTLAGWGSLLLGCLLVAHRFDKLARVWALPGVEPLQHVFDFAKAYAIFFFLAPVFFLWAGRALRSQGLVKVQREDLAMTHPDPIARLEHDHVPMSELLGELRQVLASCEGGGAAAREAQGHFCAVLRELSDELFEHFAREEEGLFPFVERELPARAGDVAQLKASHDAICGAAARIAHLAEPGPAAFEGALSQIGGLFARFDEAYGRHARAEHEMLRSLGAELTVEQRRALEGVIRGL